MKVTVKGCEQRGKSLWKSQQKFVNNAAKVYESHGKSLWTTLQRQKFMKYTEKVDESHGKKLWTMRQNFTKITGKVCEDDDKSL